MKMLTRLLGIVLLVGTSDSVFAVQSAESGFISVNPSVYVFKEASVNSTTGHAEIAVKNVSESSLSVGELSVTGTHADQYQISADACSNKNIAPHSQCLVTVQYAPTSRGYKQALLNIPSNATDTPVLQMFLSSREDQMSQSARRLPPVLYRMNIPETMTAGQSYTLDWSILGYHNDYTSVVALFDCTGKAEGDCGNSYEENFFNTSSVSSQGKQLTSWHNGEVYANEFRFSAEFTPSATTFTQETDIVVRFYRRSVSDKHAGNSSLSLLVPGNLSPQYYDKEGRRIQKKILP